MEFLNLRRDSVLVLIGEVAEGKNDSKALRDLQNLLCQMTGWAEVVVVKPQNTANAQEYLQRHFSNRNCCAFLRVFYIGHLDPEYGDCLFPGDGRISASEIREAYEHRKYKPQLEVGITGPAHPGWEAKEDNNGPCMKVFFTSDDGSSHLTDGIGILNQEGFKFEHFVHAVWPEASIVKWRWDKSCKDGEKGTNKNNNNNNGDDNSTAPFIIAGVVGAFIVLGLAYHFKRA